MPNHFAKRAIFIGNRWFVLEALLRLESVVTTAIWALRGSVLERELLARGLAHQSFAPEDKAAVLTALAEAEYDLLVSNGCPLILPVARLQRPGRVLTNIHPSLLPELRGRHPVNGALLHGHERAGATIHHLAAGVDTGAVIHQASLPITPDLDLGLLYQLLFRLEADAFSGGMEKLLADWDYPGEPQTGAGSYYNRSDAELSIDFATMTQADILRRIRAFGIRSQGVRAEVGGRKLQVFAAEAITNPYALGHFAAQPVGACLLQFEQAMLVRTRDGIVRLSRFEEVK